MTGGEGTVCLHATCVAIGDVGVLLRGGSGAGKSDVALRLIEAGAKLVADDQVALMVMGETLQASAPEILRGKLEVRGCGIIDMPYRESVSLQLVIDLVQRAEVPRLPVETFCKIEDRDLPRYQLFPFEPSCPAKIGLLAEKIDDRCR